MMNMNHKNNKLLAIISLNAVLLALLTIPAYAEEVEVVKDILTAVDSAADDVLTNEPAINAAVSEDSVDETIDAVAQEITKVNEAEGLSLDSFKRLVDDEQYDKAYAQGQEMLFNHEGDPDFDLLYATTAIETKQNSEAIFILNRLLEDDPDNARYQLELARAYYQSGQREKAKGLFESVLASDAKLPENVENKILIYLAAVESGDGFDEPVKSATLNGFVGLAAGYDSNANAASDAETITQYFQGNAFTGPNLSEEEGTAYISHQVAGSYIKPLSERTALDLRVFFSKRKNKSELSDLDNGAAFFEIGNPWRFEKGIARFSLRYTGVTFGDDDLYDLISFNTSWVQPVDWKFADSLNLGFLTGALRYSDELNESRDINSTNISAGISKQQNKFIHGANLIAIQDKAQGVNPFPFIINNPDGTTDTFTDVPADHYSRNAIGLAYSLRYLYDSKTVFYGSLSYLNSKYKANDPNYFIAADEFAKRDGDQIIFALGSQYSLSKSLQLKANLSIEEITSDLPVYEYSRNKVEVGASYQL